MIPLALRSARFLEQLAREHSQRAAELWADAALHHHNGAIEAGTVETLDLHLCGVKSCVRAATHVAAALLQEAA
jgi:hypothetical protein